MKRKLYFMSALAVIALFFAACSNLGDVAESGNSRKDILGSPQALTLKLGEDSFDIARNINPGDWLDDNQTYDSEDVAGNLVYVLTGYTISISPDADADGTITDEELATFNANIASFKTVPKSTDESAFIQNDSVAGKYKIFTFEKLMKGEAEVMLKPLFWYLKLTAYQSDVKDKAFEDANGTGNFSVTVDDEGNVTNATACLVGACYADLSQGGSSVTFKMIPPSQLPAKSGDGTSTNTQADNVSALTEALGKAEIALTFTPPDNFKKVEVGFYKADDTGVSPNYNDGLAKYYAKSAGKADAGNDFKPVGDAKWIYESVYTPKTESDDEKWEIKLSDGAATPAYTAVEGASVVDSENAEDGYSHTYKLAKENATTEQNDGLITAVLKAGIYWLRAVFYDSEGKRLTVYAEKVIIDGRNTSYADRTLDKDVFNSAPKNIEDLTLAYTFNNIKFTSNPKRDYYGAHQTINDPADILKTYIANLSWTDVPTNETGYELLIKEGDEEAFVLSPDTPATKADREKLFVKYGLTKADPDDETKVVADENKLAPGTTGVALTLDTGVKYQISVRAYNNWSVAYGSTAYTDAYLARAEAAGYDCFIQYQAREDTADDADNATFGLFTVDYNLNGGIIKQTSARKTKKNNVHYVIPYIYMESAYNVFVDEEDFPYIKRSGYNFVGWNELYGNSAIKINHSGGSGAAKAYFSSPNYVKTTSGTGSSAKTYDVDVFNPDTMVDTDSEASYSVDSVVNKIAADGTASPIAKKGGARKTTGYDTGNTTEGTLAAYSWTKQVTVGAKNDDGLWTYTEGGETKVIPANAKTTPAQDTLSAGATATLTNIMFAGAPIEADNIKNREVFASWETPLKMAIKLPRYPEFKLTRTADAGDPLVYQIGDKIEVTVNERLTDVSFVIYKDNPVASIDELLAEDGSYVLDASDTKNGITVTKDSAAVAANPDADPPVVAKPATPAKLEWQTSKTATDTAYRTDAMTYYIKVSGTYTYDSDDTSNSLAGMTDKVEGFIYISIEN